MPPRSTSTLLAYRVSVALTGGSVMLALCLIAVRVPSPAVRPFGATTMSLPTTDTVGCCSAQRTSSYELAKGLGLERNLVMGSFHRLEAAGYVRQVDPPPDARPQVRGGDPRTWFELTPDGRDFADQTVPDTQRLIRTQARSLGISL